MTAFFCLRALLLIALFVCIIEIHLRRIDARLQEHAAHMAWEAHKRLRLVSEPPSPSQTPQQRGNP